MSKIDNAWGAVVEAASILKMTAAYTQAKNIPEEQYMHFKQIVRQVAEDESLPSGCRAVARAFYDLCPHGEEKSETCEQCVEEAFSHL